MRHSPGFRIVPLLAAAALATLTRPVPVLGQAPGEKYALLVGVKQYDPNELRALPYAEPDVSELARVFKDAGYRQVVTLCQTAGASNFRLLPTAANVRTTLKGMLEHREPIDTVVVAFAGHGVQFPNAPESFFCPMDAKLADRATLISLDEVYRELERSRAGVKFLLVDACRNDPQSDNSRSRAVVRLESVTRPQERRPPGGVAALFSCSPGERAFEHERLKHGVFFNFVIQGLKGEADFDKDGTVAVEELALFTKRRVPDFVKEEYGFDVFQVPVLKGEVGGLGGLVSRARSPEPEPKPDPPPKSEVATKSGRDRPLKPESRPNPVTKSDVRAKSLARLNHPSQPKPNPTGGRPNLYVLAIGISAYTGALRLNYAAQDAEAIERVFRAKSGTVFGRIEVKRLTDAAATRDKIFDALEWLDTFRKKTTRDDVVVLFFSGQGKYDTDFHEFSLHSVESGRDPDFPDEDVLLVQFEMSMRGIPARFLLLLDFCRPGPAGNTMRKAPANRTAEYIKGEEVWAPNQHGDVAVMLASTTREFSLEDASSRQGYFTEALVAGLSGAADVNKDSIVDLDELETYVCDRVRERTGNRQHPFKGRSSGAESFPLSRP